MQATPAYEYSVFFRFLQNGQPGPLQKKFFLNAGRVRAFLDRIDPASPMLITVGRRQVGSWELVAECDLEQLAADEEDDGSHG